MESNQMKSSQNAIMLPTAKHQGCPLRVQRHDMFKFMRWNLWFCAMYRLPFERYFPTYLRFLATTIDWIYELFLYFTLIHIDILFICTIFRNHDKDDLELIVSYMIQAVIYTWALIIKVFFKRIQAKRLHFLMEYLNVGYRTHSAAGFTYVTMKESITLSNTWIKIFISCCYAGGAFWLMVPIFTGERSLPLACWYPFDYKVPVVYEIVYLLQTIGQIQIAGSISCTSSFYLLVSVLFSGQFDVLNCSLKNILATTYIKLRKSKSELIALRGNQQITDFELNQYYSAKEHITDLDCIPHLLDVKAPKSESFYAAFKNALVPCIEHHRYILFGLGELEKLYTSIWFLKTFEVTLLICLIAFSWVKSTASNSFGRILSLSQYLILTLWEMFMICYAGEIIFSNSQRCGEALQRSPWYVHSSKIKQDVLFFMLNAQRPFRMTGGKMYDLNMEKFRTILTTSFSIFTILQKMDQRRSHPK